MKLPEPPHPSMNDLLLMVGDKEVTIARYRKLVEMQQAEIATLKAAIQTLTPASAPKPS